MSSSILSKRKRDDTLPVEETTNATQMPTSKDNSCEEVLVQPIKNKSAMSSQTTAEGVTEERQYLTTPTKQKAEYRKDFKIYLSKEGMRRAECKFCSITYAADPNNNGTKNVRNHWVACQKNPANEGKGKQKKLILELIDDKPGKGKLKKLGFEC